MVRFPVVASIAGGDTNLSGVDLRALAKESGAKLIRGHGVDALLVVGATEKSVTVLPDGGSDHPPVVYVLGIDGHDYTVLAWNVYVGQSPLRVKWRLRRLIRKYRPDAVMLSEAYRCRPQIAALAERLHYQHIQGPNVGEQADCALLVRLDHAILRTGSARMQRRWSGLAKHGRPVRQPRVYPRARTVHKPTGAVVRLLDLHFPRAGADNAEAIAESKRRTVNWFRKGHR